MAAPMSRKVHSVKIKTFSPKENKFYTCFYMNNNDYDILFPFDNHSEGIITLSPHKHHVNLKEVNFTMFKVARMGSDNQNKSTHGQKGLTVWCTRRFLNENRLVEGRMVQIKSISLFPLKKMVLGVTLKDEPFVYACSEKFTTDFLLSVCRDRIVASEGQYLTVPSGSLAQGDLVPTPKDEDISLKVLECEPLKHGFVTVNTEIVLTKLGSEINDEFTNVDIKNKITFDSPALMSDFTQCLSIEKKLSEICSNSRNPSYSQIPCIVVSDSSQFFNSGQTSEFDSSNLIGMSKLTLMKHGLFDDSLVTIDALKIQKLENNPSDSKNESAPKLKKAKYERVARIQMVNCPDDCVVMPPSLWFNLTKSWKGFGRICDSTVAIKKYEPFEEEPTIEDIKLRRFSQSPSWRNQLPSASAIHVSLVQCPGYSQTASCRAALQKYFSIPRFVRKGDIIVIPPKLDPDFDSESHTQRSGRCAVLYFKVSHVTPEVPVNLTFLADVNHTDLFQEANVKSYVPSAVRYVDEEELPICGLNQYMSKLQEVILPQLTRNSKRSLALSRDVPSVLLTGPSGCGKSVLCQQLAASLNMHIVRVNCHSLTGDTSASTEAKVKAVLQQAEVYSPCLLVLNNIHSLGKDRDGHSEDPRVSGAFHGLVRDALKKADWPVVVIATTNNAKLISTDLRAGFLHQFTIEVPDESCRRQMIEQLIGCYPRSSDVTVNYIAQRTAGFVLGDLVALISQAKQMALDRVVDHCKTGAQPLSQEEEEDIALCGTPLVHQDFETALDKLQAAHSDAIGAPKIPDVKWDDVGGLAEVKAEILDTIQLPLQHPELLSAGLRRSGVLLYGPPGTGKTLLAKAVATECSLNFLSVKGPELINMYVGQSEENVREVFARARSASPCVIFFDELDSLAPNRGRTGDSGGVMDRVVSQLLAELDGLHRSSDVFVVGATNRPDLLDPALLRPGRFDKLLYLGVSQDKQAQLKILKALTRKFSLCDDGILERIADKCPMNLTGADLYALCSDAMLNAVKSRIDAIERGSPAVEGSGNLQVTEQDFLQALSTLVPSVSESELQRYQHLQQTIGAQG